MGHRDIDISLLCAISGSMGMTVDAARDQGSFRVSLEVVGSGDICDPQAVLPILSAGLPD